jgi:hypothetical protein
MKDLIIDEYGNMKIKNGDFAIENCEEQICRHLVNAFTGEYKHAPTLGGNAKNLLNGIPSPFWSGDIKKQLKTQFIEVNELYFQGSELIIDINEKSKSKWQEQ